MTPEQLNYFVAQLNDLKRSHYICEDCWYSCPLSEEGCCDDRQDECNCGAAEHNEKIHRLIDWGQAVAG
jgi:hypothetical protein